ncbi:MAG: YfhO family protein, partial [Bacteroidaceae bacterium]
MGYYLEAFEWSDFYYVAFLLLAYSVAFLLFRVSFLYQKFLCLSKSKRFYITLFLVTTSAVVLVYFNFLIGKEFFVYSDMGSDTRETYLPFYINVVENIKAGQFGFWNFDAGLGLNTFALQLYLCDPFAFLIIIPGGLLLGVAALPFLLLVCQILKIYLCVFFCNKVLTYFNIGDSGRMLASVIYGFNGFLMLWGSHYWFGTASVFLIVLLFVIEKEIHKPSPKSAI